MADSSNRGRFVWYDLMTTDAKGAQAFYPKVVGWGTEVWQGPQPYTMWTNGGTPMAGIMPMPGAAGAPPHWLAYIGVPDVDATVKEAESRGAKTMVKPQDIPKVGRFAVLTDPQGAAFAVFKSENESPESAGGPKAGEFSWHELATTDYDAGFRFYEALFGWNKEMDHDMGPMGVYRIFGRNGQQLGGMFNKPPEIPSPNWLQYVMVDGATAAADRVKANGGQVLVPPMEVPGGDWIAQCMDPQGAMFAVHSKKQ